MKFDIKPEDIGKAIAGPWSMALRSCDTKQSWKTIEDYLTGAQFVLWFSNWLIADNVEYSEINNNLNLLKCIAQLHAQRSKK